MQNYPYALIHINLPVISSSSGFNKYLQEINNIPSLTKEEEFLCMFVTSNAQARFILIRLAASVIRDGEYISPQSMFHCTLLLLVAFLCALGI